MLRLFVAIPLPEIVRTDLAELCSGLPGAKWVDSENMHLSLRFIGEVGRRDADEIHHMLARVNSPAFDLVVAGVGCFESGRKIRTLWAGVEKQRLLYRLREKVEAAVVRTGAEPSRRKFKAHITLARFKNGTSPRIGTFVENHDCFRSGPFRIDHFSLFQSHLGSGRAYYEMLAEYPLQNEDLNSGSEYAQQ